MEPHICWWEWKMVQLLWKTFWWFPQNGNTELLPDPAIPLLGTDPKGLRTDPETSPRAHTFTAAGPQQRTGRSSPKVHQQTKRGLSTQQYDSAIKRNDILINVTGKESQETAQGKK